MLIENLVFLPDSPYSEWIIQRSEKLVYGLNRYLVVVDDKNQRPKYTNSEVQVIDKTDLIGGLKEENLESYQRIIVHYHTPFIGFFILKQKARLSNSKLIWVIWSGDLYKHFKFQKKAYTEATRITMDQKTSFLENWRGAIHHRFLQAIGRPNKFSFEKSFAQFDYVATIFEKDVREAESVLGVKAKWIRFALLSLDEMFTQEYLEQSPSLGRKIMIGHSGSPENNHLDVFEKIHQLVPENTVQILSPLSYGNPKFIAEVKKKGREYFGNRLEILEDFIPREEYYQKLSEVSIAIFNHKIQQAFGNILGLIFMGVKVCLNPENPVFIEMTRNGIKIINYQELTKEDLLNPLSESDIQHNRNKIRALFNEELIQTYYQDLYRA